MAAIKRGFVIPSGLGVSANDLYLTSTTDATNSTGSLIVSGGSSIGKSLAVNGSILLYSGSYYTAWRSSATANTVYTLPATSPATGSSVLQSTSAGVLSWVPMVASSGSGTTASNVDLVSGTSNTSHYIVFSQSSSGSGVALSSGNPLVYNPSTKILSTSGLAVTATTPSSSSTTGALVVAGGVGIGDSLFVGSGQNGIIIQPFVTGGYGALYSTNITPSTSNASFLTNGSAALLNGVTNVHLSIGAQQKLSVDTNTITIKPTTGSGTSSTGALVVTGGAAIGQSLSIGGRLQIFNATNYAAFKYTGSGSTVYTLPTSSPATGSSVLQSDLSGTMSWVPMASLGNTIQNIAINSAGSANVYHPMLFTPSSSSSGSAISSDSTISFNPSSEILYVSGLAITSGTASTSSTTGALTITGGVGIGGSLYVGGDLTINGTTTTINSVTLTVDDKNIELGSVTSPSDVTAEGGGITLKGATDKSLNWYTGTGWSSSESFNLASGNTFKINNTTVLSNSSIGTGITNSYLTALGTISTGVWAGTLITALYGGTGYNSYTKGDLLVGAGSTIIKLGVGSDNRILIASSNAGSGLSWAQYANPTYGSFYSTSTQQVVGAGATTLATFNNTYEANRVAILGGSGTSSRIQIQDAGPYSITFSAQINLISGNQPKVGDFWFRVNGQDVPQSNTEMTISGKDFQTVITVNFVYSFQANDYFELVFSSSDAQYALEAKTGLVTPPRPDIPSIILSVLPVTHVIGSSGTATSGIQILNGATQTTQYFQTGTSGSDFNISTAGAYHTFNIPDVSVSARGLITTGSQTIGGLKTFASGISITSSTASTSTSSGALIVSGGVGIGGSLYVASATAISGVTINNGIITGSLTGTATTAQNVNIVSALASAQHPILFTPATSTASGAAVSSNSTLSYNPSTNILSVSGAAITSSTASTSSSTGALVITGGVGIGNSLSVGGTINFFNAGTSNYSGFKYTGSGSTVYTLPSSSPATGSSVLQSTSAGVLSWIPMTSGIAVSGITDGVIQFKSGSSLGATNSLFFDTSLLGLRVSGFPGGNTPSSTDAVLKLESTIGSFNGSTSGTYIAVNAPSGFAGDLMNLQVNATSKLKIDNTGAIIQNIGTNSTSTTSGAVQIKGGVGITGALYVGEVVNTSSTTVSTSTSTGSIVASGGAGIAGTLNVGGTTKIFSSTASTNTSTGALLVAGGVGISGQLSFAQASFGYTGINFNPSMSFIGNTSSSPITLTVLTDNSLNFEGSSGLLFAIDNNLSSGEIFSVNDISGLSIISASAGQTVNINEFGGYTQIGNGSINSTSTSTGSLVIAGGLGFTGNAFIGGTTTITNGTNSTSTGSGALIVNGGFGLTGNAFIGGTTTITNGTNSSSTGSGSLVVNGGLGVTGNANIGGTVRITNTAASTSSSTGALTVSGGVGIGQTLFIGGNLYQNSNAITAYDTGFRNRIINGDFYIDQRVGGGTTVPSATQNVTDRWKMNINGSGRITSGQNYGGVASPSPFTSYYGMKVTTTTTPGIGDYNFFSHVIEGPNTNDFQWGTSDAQTITLSFWAYSSLTGTFGGSVRNYGTYNRSYPFTYTISSSNTWEKKTVVIPGDTTGTWTTSISYGIELIFIIANGTTYQASPGAWTAGNYHGPSGSLANLIGTLNSTLYLTGVQIELGNAATPFEKRNYGHELFLCQRYYQISEVRVGAYQTTGNYIRGSAYLNTTMRAIASPVLTVLSTDESANLGVLNPDTSNFRGDSFRYLVQVTTTGDAYGQWKVSCDAEF